MKFYNFLSYNTEIKIAGASLTIKNYEKIQFYQYLAKQNTKTKDIGEIAKETYEKFMLDLKFNNTRKANMNKTHIKILGQAIEERKKERFFKNAMKAREKIFDYVNCNNNKWKDSEGKKQKTKFLTLTFKENVTNLGQANEELTKFFKRLSFYAYNKRKNVIKYIAVPELQERGAWHFHIIMFNVKYIPFKKLLNIWGNGGVYINSLEKVEEKNVAKYITKYMTKILKIDSKDEKNQNYYQIYKEKNLINKKRFSCSKGLLKPYQRKLSMKNNEMCDLMEYIVLKYKEQIKFNEYKNEYRGNVKIINVELKDKDEIKEIKKYINILMKNNIESNQKEKRINWQKIEHIRRKMSKEMENERLEEEYIKYNAIVSF